MSDSDKWYEDDSGNPCELLPTGSYLQFNIPLGSDGYGLRDNSGTVQIKNRGGSWATPVYPGDAMTASTVTATSLITGLSQKVLGANGQAVTIAQSSQLVSTTAGTTVNTTIDIPAAAIILGVTARVTVTTSATATNFTVKGATSGHTFTNTLGVNAGDTAVGMDTCPYISGAAEKITLTSDDVNTVAGRVRVVVNYISLTAPTS